MKDVVLKAAVDAGFRTGTAYYATDSDVVEGYLFAQPLASNNCLVELEKFFQIAYKLGIKAGYSECLEICQHRDEPNTEYRRGGFRLLRQYTIKE